MAAFRRCTRAGHRSTLIRGLYPEKERKGEREREGSRGRGKRSKFRRQGERGSGLQSGGGEREASGREARRKLRLRTSVRSASELPAQHRTREELAGSLTRKRGKEREELRGGNERKERRGERDVRKEGKEEDTWRRVLTCSRIPLSPNTAEISRVPPEAEYLLLTRSTIGVLSAISSILNFICAYESMNFR